MEDSLRYTVLSASGGLSQKIATNSRVIAYKVAFSRTLFCSDVYIVDNDNDAYIFAYCKGSQELCQ